jgi:hypothetical protein
MAAGDVVVLPPLFGSQPVYLNLYVLLVGPSTTMRKTTVLNFVRGLMPANEMTERPFMAFMDDVSIQAFNRTLADQGKLMAPVLLSVDEVAGLFQQMRNRSGSYLVGLDKTLMRAYDHSPVAIHRVNQTIDAERGAFVCVFAATTPEPLMEVLGAEDVESGLLPRFLVFDVRDSARGSRRSLLERAKASDEWVQQEADLKAWLSAIAEDRSRGIPSGQAADGALEFPQTVLSITDEALERLDQVDALFSSEAASDPTGWAAIKGRAFWHIAKLAGLFALSRAGKTATVELEDVLRSIWLVETTVSDLGKMQEDVGSNLLERRINEAIRLASETRGGRIKVSSLARQMRLSAQDLRELMGTLLVRDLIEVHKDDEGNPTYWKVK